MVISLYCQNIVSKISDEIINKTIKLTTYEFAMEYATLEGMFRKTHLEEYNTKSEDAISGACHLLFTVPQIIKGTVCVTGTFIYMIFNNGIPVVIIAISLLQIISLYYFSKTAENINKIYKNRALRNTELNNRHRFHVGMARDRILHKDDIISSKIITESKYRIHAEFTNTTYLISKKINVWKCLFALINMIGFYISENRSYTIFKLFTEMDSLSVNILNNYLFYKRSGRSAIEFELLREKYKPSLAKESITGKIIMYSMNYINENSFQLKWEGKPLTIEGLTYWIHGSNGSGKTTFLNIISGFIEDVEVNMTVDGISTNWADISNKVIIEQDDPINFAQGSWYEAIGERFEECISIVGLNKIYMQRKNNSCIGELSGGQRRRLLIARGIGRLLSTGGNILIMDEPEAHIDDTFADIILNLRQVYHGAIFMSLHNANLASQIKPDVEIEVNDGVACIK
ncbi:taurine import ATP-binding protein [Pacmanvirus S19]|nr:taurine import ATP-binding protein [Pacmanvirus S19]